MEQAVSILDQINPLPEGFLASRLPALEAAYRREYLRTGEAIPEVSSWPGIWAPFVKPIPPAPKIHHPSPRAPRPYQSRSNATGEIPAGTIIPTFCGNGTVLGYIKAGDDPMAVVPPGTPVWQLSGARKHGPSIINRYVVKTVRNDLPWFLFEKAVSLETRLKGIK
jgi:hypothetical protein